jgi:bacterial/archaeal transporter family-2 protein
MNEAAPFLIAFALGVMLSVYQPMNASVSRLVGSPILANVVFYFIGWATSVVLLLASGGYKYASRLRDTPPILYTAGIMSAFMVLGTIILLPRLGARRLFLLQVAGQILMAMFVAHFGLLGLPQDPLTPRKIAGAVLLLAGAIISLG